MGTAKLLPSWALVMVRRARNPEKVARNHVSFRGLVSLAMHLFLLHTLTSIPLKINARAHAIYLVKVL